VYSVYPTLPSSDGERPGSPTVCVCVCVCVRTLYFMCECSHASTYRCVCLSCREMQFPNSWRPNTKKTTQTHKPRPLRLAGRSRGLCRRPGASRCCVTENPLNNGSSRDAGSRSGSRCCVSPRSRRSRRSGPGRSRSAGSPTRRRRRGSRCRRRRRRSSARPRWAGRGTGRCAGRTRTRRGRGRPEETCPPSDTCTLQGERRHTHARTHTHMHTHTHTNALE